MCGRSSPFNFPHLAKTMIVFIQTVPKEGACMVWSSLRVCSVLECLVILFQVFGVAALCVSRLVPSTATRWVKGGKVGFVVAMIGLGLAGALCGRHDSEFALFAGGTMTILFIGMTMGNSPADTTSPARGFTSAEPTLAA
jgi:hypothetical protein